MARALATDVEELPLSVPRLRAPKEHGQILAIPPFDQVAALLERNRKTLGSASLSPIGKSLGELRALARREALDLSAQYHREAGEPSLSAGAPDLWLVAGHQPELFHPGVWFKNFVLARLAKKYAATAINLIVDTDAAKPAILHVPAGERVARLPFDRSTLETPYEERIVEDEAAFASLSERVAPLAASWGFEPMLPLFWREVMVQARRTLLLGERFAGARRAIERRWGVVQSELPMSRMCSTRAFAWFAGAILSDLPRFHAIYNETVRDYRRANRIRSRSHPVPDLVADGAWLEAPFWAWHKGQARRGKLLVRQTAEGWALRVGGENWPTIRRDFVADWRALELQGFKVRPRALTTTMFARLCLADVFLHGIGGGIYDALTDQIIERAFGISAPGYLIVSATLLLPLPRIPDAAQRRRDLARLERDLIYKPEHFVNAIEATEPLLRAKREWIARNGASHAERVERFEQIRAINARLFACAAPPMEDLRADRAACARQVAQDSVAARRDYAFCLYPEEQLQAFFANDSASLPI